MLVQAAILCSGACLLHTASGHPPTTAVLAGPRACAPGRREGVATVGHCTRAHTTGTAKAHELFLHYDHNAESQATITTTSHLLLSTASCRTSTVKSGWQAARDNHHIHIIDESEQHTEPSRCRQADTKHQHSPAHQSTTQHSTQHWECTCCRQEHVRCQVMPPPQQLWSTHTLST